MKPHKNNMNDEFESRLSNYSLLSPSDSYGEIAVILRQKNRTTGWRFQRWIAAVTLSGIAMLLATNTNVVTYDNPSQKNSSQSIAENDTVTHDDTIITSTTQVSVAAKNDSIEQIYIEGRDYIELSNPAIVTNQGTTDVAAFFWYPCWPCAEFEEYLTDWESTLDSNVMVTRIPAIWSSSMRFHARAFYTAQLLEVTSASHRLFYTAFDRENPTVRNEEDLQRFFESLGVSASEFYFAYESDTVETLLQQAEALNRAYQVQSTPTIYVGGRFSISPANAGGFSEVIEVANFLIDNQ